MTITVITPTGSRPEAFALCERFMKNQTVQPDQWIVIDDGPEHTNCTMGQQYIRGPKLWKPTLNTQRLNLDEALKHVTGDYIFVVEDDDFYAPQYLEVCSKLLQYVDAVGEINTKYYHLQHGSFKQMQNFEHAALCQTGFRKSLLPMFEQAVNSGEYYIDITFWKLLKRKKANVIRLESDLCLGVKGLPGRPGLGIGHVAQGFVSDDLIFTQLRKWTGDDFECYKPFLPKRDHAKS